MVGRRRRWRLSKYSQPDSQGFTYADISLDRRSSPSHHCATCHVKTSGERERERERGERLRDFGENGRKTRNPFRCLYGLRGFVVVIFV